MIKLRFSEKLAYNFLEGESMAGIPEMALEALMEGYETPSLVILAGLGENESRFVIYEHYKQMLHEMGLVFEKEQTRLFMVRAIIDKTLNEELDPVEACEFLFNFTMNPMDSRISDDPIAEGGLQEIFYIHLNMVHLLDDSRPFVWNKEHYEALDAMKQQTRVRFQEWLDLKGN